MSRHQACAACDTLLALIEDGVAAVRTVLAGSSTDADRLLLLTSVRGTVGANLDRLAAHVYLDNTPDAPKAPEVIEVPDVIEMPKAKTRTKSKARR